MADEKKYPYTTVPNNLRKLLAKIPSLGSPPTASQKWLESIGFTGGNNKSLLPVLRHIGVITASGEPTEYWTALRSGDKATFSDAVRESYKDLFVTYTDAHKQPPETLRTFFRTHTGLGEKAQSFCVRTFQVLVEFGDFNTATDLKRKVKTEADRKEEKLDLQVPREDDRVDPPRRTRSRSEDTPPLALTVNLQIELPPSADGEVYDKLFAAMGKHLKGLITPPK
jgi:hypothetical protein